MKAQHRLSSDIISTLPADIIETILCLLPIQEAARTSILSRDWRYKWTKIPRLVFNEDSFQVSTDEKQPSFVEESVSILSHQRIIMSKKHRLLYAVNQVLLLHQGPITEFTLPELTYDSNAEIDQIIPHLSRRNTVKKLHLSYFYDKLSLSLFSFRKLTDLYLHTCYIRHQLTFNGFGCLTNLHLECVQISKKMLLHLLVNCPLLKSFTLVSCYYNIDLNGLSIHHLTEHYKLLQLYYYNNISLDDEDLTLIELFECLRMIENLTIDVWGIHMGTGCLFLLRSSPNLEKIKIQMLNPPSYDKFVDYSDIKLEHLIELEIENFCNSKLEVELVKVILAKSPVLKRVRIFLDEKVAKDEEFKMSRLLLNFPCASIGVKIIVK